MKIDNKHRAISWEKVALEFQSERDALQRQVFRLQEEVQELQETISSLLQNMEDEGMDVPDAPNTGFDPSFKERMP